MDIRVFDDTRCVLGESPLWDSRLQALYWVDSISGRIYRRGWEWPAAQHWDLGEEVGCIGLTKMSHMLIVGGRSGILLFDTRDGSKRLLTSPEPDKPLNRLNDGKVDPAGRFWCGSLQEGQYAPVGSLWSYEAGGDLSCWASEITIPNALCWSPDGRRMYFADSPTRSIDVFDFDPASGVASNRRLFAHLAQGAGFPDGATTDEVGDVWCANIDGGRVSRFSSAGELAGELPVPVSRPTCCAFGGPDLQTLFITSATRRLSVDDLEGQPNAGCVLAVQTSTRGRREPLFALEN